MITTTTIERLCCDLELQWPDAEWKQERLQWLSDALDAGRYGDVEKAFAHIGTEPVRSSDRLQLACEAIKFLTIRLSGRSLHQAMDQMVSA